MHHPGTLSGPQGTGVEVRGVEVRLQHRTALLRQRIVKGDAESQSADSMGAGVAVLLDHRDALHEERRHNADVLEPHGPAAHVLAGVRHDSRQVR
eukprot:9471254-Pyramimonas_sp.AAC.1